MKFLMVAFREHTYYRERAVTNDQNACFVLMAYAILSDPPYMLPFFKVAGQLKLYEERT